VSESFGQPPNNQILTALNGFDEAHYLAKEELLPDGRAKLILKEKYSGRINQKFVD
jgi:hypothetical protein